MTDLLVLRRLSLEWLVDPKRALVTYLDISDSNNSIPSILTFIQTPLMHISRHNSMPFSVTRLGHTSLLPYPLMTGYYRPPPKCWWPDG